MKGQCKISHSRQEIVPHSYSSVCHTSAFPYKFGNLLIGIYYCFNNKFKKKSYLDCSVGVTNNQSGNIHKRAYLGGLQLSQESVSKQTYLVMTL